MLPATPIILLGAPLIELSSVDSTNIYAMKQIQEQIAVSGSCYRTDFQTHGKGQHGRVWESSKGENLLCSYVLELKTLKMEQNWGPKDQIGLSAAVALGAQAFFAAFAGDETRIKKPNDIYWRDRKAGGILIENILRGESWTWTVIGIGFNMNQTKFSSDAPNPVSLKQITGKQWEISSMQKSLTKALDHSIGLWLENGEVETLKAFEKQIIEIPVP
ncbi:MAG: biotin--[acetyl-CoA-carboxylase] ligase [Chitinophagaceae bacterium]|nr:MAG: biotin--[acetyl-CoA-carboxylase] ligase [Chitinophagaceae bacterium]